MGRKSEINKKDLLNLYEISDEEFARITDNLYSQKIDYKSLPNLVLLPNVKEELRNELNIKGNLYITKNRLLHTNPIRKNAHKKQGFTKDEYKAIPDTIRKATYALKETDSEYNSFLITALDKNDSTKANCIIFDEDTNGNLLTTIKKVPLLSLRNRTYEIVGTGVEPAISNALREPSTTLTTSPNDQNLTTKEDFVKTQAYANIEERNVALERTSDMENITADEAARIYLAQELKVNIPELTESERAAAIAIMEAGAASMQTSISDYIQNTFPDGIFGDFSKTQDAAHQQGVEINGAVSVRGFGDSVKATIYAGKTADFSTWVHELSHVWQAQLSGKLKNDAEKAFQVKDGNWQKSIYTFEDGHTDTSAEAFAYGFEDFLKKKAGEMAAEDKKAIFEKFADYMARTYNGTKEHIKINENISKVYEQFVRLDDNILAQAEKAVQQEKEFNKNLSENERQRIAVRERYKDTDLWLKAPNGKISNLTEEQWVTVHTPNFKRWFGNWDYDENKKIEPVELNLASVEFNHNNAREVEKWMKENLSGKSVEVSSSGAKVLFFNKGLQDSLKRHGEIQRDSYSVMESLVENAELFDFVANDGKDKHKGILGQDIYYSALKVDDKYYSVQFKFNVSGKYFTDSYKDHKIAEIKIAPLPYRGSNNAHADTSAIHSFTISELTGGVKPEFSKVIDANGEPLVVYHGSPNSSFDVFDRNKIGTTTDYGLYGKGFYFSNQKPQAEMYGETTEVFLNIRKPLSIDDFNSPEQLANELDAYPEYFVMQNGRVKPSGSFTGFDLYLEAKNYDGVLVKQTESLNEIVSFKPNQIKSAANNNGNFDINNDSILFQLVGERSIMRMAQNEERKRILEDLAAAKLMDEKYSNIEPSLKATRIRFATGWEKSADGQWKYELDDSLNRIKSGSLFEKILSTSPEMLEQLTKNTTLTLDDIMEAPELYGVFPFMKNVRVGFYSDPNAFRAVLTPDGIKINTKYLDGISGEKGMKGVLAHEIQHIIQAVEYSGSTGINGESIEQLYNNMMEAMKAASIKRYDYDVSSLEHGLSEYMHDSGEIEARNVARRIFMNASERRHTTLESTEDIARNLQFQIIGEQGAGELDRNTETNERIANLDTAKKMEEAAKDAKAIRLATGWEKGVDGKWKYEIDDSKVHFNLYDAMEEWDELHPRYEELREKFFKTGLSEEEQKEFDQWIDERNEVSDKHTDMDFSEKLFGKTFKLPEVMRHNELFKAYPELKDVTVSIQRTGESGTLGNASYEDKHINLYRNEKDIGSFEEWEKKAGSILLHEVQHIIQGIEGFAKGSNPKMFEETPEASELSKALASYRSYTKEQLQNFSVNQEKQNYRDLGMTDAQIAELSKDVEGLGTVEEIIERGVKEHGAEWMYNEIQYAVKEVDKAGKIVVDGKSFMSNMEAYMVSAGEVESRNVQARMRFTPEQRINTLLSDTADIAPKDQIVMFDVPTSESRDIKNTNEERSVALKADSQENKMESISATMKSATKDFMDLNATSITEERTMKSTENFESQEYWKNQFKQENADTFKAIDDYLEKGIRPKNNEFIFKNVPEVLKYSGISKNDIILTTGIINKAKNTHNLSDKEIKNAILSLSTPVAIFDSDKDKSENNTLSIINITDIEAENNKPIAITINLDNQRKGYEQKYLINEIRSIHDRTLIAKNGVNIVQEWAKAGLLKYVDDKKISNLVKEREDSFLLPLAKLDKDNINLSPEIVNGTDYQEIRTFSEFAEQQKAMEKEYQEWEEMLDDNQNAEEIIERNMRKEPEEQNENKIQKMALSKDVLESLTEIGNTIKNDSAMILKSPSFGDVTFSTGVFGDLSKKNNGGYGINHIVEGRYVKDGLTQQDIASLLYLIKDAVETTTVEIDDSKSRQNIIKDGIWVTLRKDFDGIKQNWIITGFAENDEKGQITKEAADAIKAVNAQYGYAPEHLFVSEQVGAVIASLNNVAQNILMSSDEERIKNFKEVFKNTQFLDSVIKNENTFSKEATDTIQTVIAQNSYALEHSSIREQVGAVIDSISLDKEKSTEKQTLPPYVKTLNSLIDQAVKEEKIGSVKTQDGETKQKKQTPPNLTKKAASDFLRAVQEGTAPFFSMQNDDFGKITMTPQLIVNAQTGLPFKEETQLLAQIYSAEQDMNGQIVTSMEGAKEAGTYIKKCDEAMKNFVLVNQQHLSGENKVMPTRYFSPEAAENPDMVYANVLHKNRPAKIKSFRKLCLHFERIPEGQKDIQTILTKIAWEHLKEIQRELKLPDGWKTENLTEKDILEKKEYIKNYFEKVPARERTVFQETFGICTDVKKEYGDPAFSDKTRKIMDDKLTQFIKDNSFSAEYLAAFTKEEYDKLEDWKKEKGRRNKIEAVGIKEPEVYLGRYLAACNSHAEFITDAETIKVIKEKLSTKLKQNYKLEKYDILKEIGMQAGNICKETMKQNVFSKAHSHDKKQELSVQKDKQHPPVGMGA